MWVREGGEEEERSKGKDKGEKQEREGGELKGKRKGKDREGWVKREEKQHKIEVDGER